MNHRDVARNYFKDCNLSYDDITLDDLYKLAMILNKHIEKASSCMIMINELKTSGRNKNIVFKNNKLIFAELRVKGTYFEDREAITFNEDKYIGLCGWADGKNLIPFVDAFMEWCDYLKGNLNKEVTL